MLLISVDFMVLLQASIPNPLKCIIMAHFFIFLKNKQGNLDASEFVELTLNILTCIKRPL